MLKKRFTELAAVVAITMSAGAAQANIFDNGGFETVDAGNAALAQNWLPAASGYTRVCGGAGNGSDCAAHREHLELARLHEFVQSQSEGDVGAGDRGGACAAVCLDDVAVDCEGAFAQEVELGDGAE